MSNNDAVIKQLLATVEQQKAALGTKPRGTWVTNGVFKKDSQTFFNINTVTDNYKLAEALGYLMSQEDYFAKACKELGIKTGEFKWDGYTVDEWKEDFEMRISMVMYSANKKKLDETKKKLNSLVSEETRTEMELEEIKALLAS